MVPHTGVAEQELGELRHMSRLPRLLLLTDIPPCRDLTAGLVLYKMSSWLPKDKLACFAVIHPEVGADLDKDFSDIPYEKACKPTEHQKRHIVGRVGELESFFVETYISNVTVKRLAKKIARFADSVRIDKIWCVLQGQTMIRLACAVKELTGRPLLTQVWDPPEWWLRHNSVDRWSKRLILRDFDRAIAGSEACAAASWGMAEEYRSQYDCNAIPVVPGLDEEIALPPAERIHDGDTVVIGFAGQIYAAWEWSCLLSTLDYVNWKIGDRNVIVRLFGRALQVFAKQPRYVEYRGWYSQEETVSLLSEADILYCPYWFDPSYEREARHSFPSKLTTYLAAGRPVLFHGPAYASPFKLLELYDAGAGCHCYSEVSIELYNTIYRYIHDEEFYARAAMNGSKAFHERLTTEKQKEQFFRFLGDSASVA